MPTKQKRPRPTAYSKENPSPHAFQPGVSGNPNGGSRPNEYRALARALRAGGAGRAPDAECDAVELPHGSSKLQVFAERLLLTMRRGRYPEYLEAAELFARVTGEFGQRLELGFDEEAEGAGVPLLEVVFKSPQYKSEADRLEAEGRRAIVTDLHGAKFLAPPPAPMVEGHLSESDIDTAQSPKPVAVAPPAKPKATRFAEFAEPRPAPPQPRKTVTDADSHRHFALDASELWPVSEEVRRQYEEDVRRGRDFLTKP